LDLTGTSWTAVVQIRWADDAVGDGFAPDPFQKLRANVFRYSFRVPENVCQPGRLLGFREDAWVDAKVEGTSVSACLEAHRTWKSRGDWTAIELFELFVAGIRGWEARLQQLVGTLADGK
jgi:hypothetical protein